MASYYDLATYDAEDERANDPQGPPMLNLYAAATYVGGLLETNGLQYAICGGFAMVCRGSPRTTSDVDMATTASMKQFWKIVEPQPKQVLPRLMIPNTKLLDKVVRIFVRTGPTFGDVLCHSDRLIEVDVNVFGGGSGPSDLVDHIETLEFDFDDQILRVNVVDIYYMMRTKLRTFTSRAAARDFDDIEFLLTYHGDEVQQISDRLDLEDRASFIGADILLSRGPLHVRQCHTLLHL